MEIQKAITEMGTAFEEFKKINNDRLEKAEKGVSTAAKEEALAKCEKHISELEVKLEKFNAALNRNPNGAENEEALSKKAAKEYAGAMDLYLKKGRSLNQDQVDFAVKTMSVDSDVDGGFFVSPERSAEMIKMVYETSPMRQFASVQGISSDSLEILHDLDQVGSGWVGEIQARPPTSTPQIKKEIIPVHELYAFPFVTQKLLDDAGINVEAYIADKVAEKFGRDENTSFINGDGVNKPKGVLNYASGVGFGKVERFITALNSAIGADDLVDLQTTLKEPYQKGAAWMINRSILGLIRKLKDSYGQYIWQPGLSVGVPSTLLGAPVAMASDLPSVFAATTDLLMYGDFKAGYQIVDRFGIRILRDALTNKPYVGFYTTKRVGGAVKNFEAIKVLRSKT